MTKKINKIVITGGSCAGKTTGMSWIQNAFTKRGYKVLFVAEAATELINSGIHPAVFSNFEFQLALMKMQITKEAIYEETAKNSEFEKVLIVCDRGKIDGKAFSDEGVFERITKEIGKTEIELRDEYDAVFHMVTAAKGAEEFYTLENNTARIENIEQARISDDRLIEAWKGHRHYKIIGNEGTFDDKIKHLIDEIGKYLGEPISFDNKKKKYLIKYPDIQTLEKMDNVEKIEMYQTYLNCTDDEKIQICKRGLNGDYVYYQTRVRIQNGQLLQVEKRLTKNDYEEKLLNADPTRKQIYRTRYCFVENNDFIEIDVYPFWNDKAILNIELNSKNEDINLPSFVEVIEDITNNNAYLNSELAKL